jgi:hypothetical protein
MGSYSTWVGKYSWIVPLVLIALSLPHIEPLETPWIVSAVTTGLSENLIHPTLCCESPPPLCTIYPDLSHCAWNKCMHVVRQMRANYILYQAMHYMMSTCTVFECYFAYVPCVRTYTIIQPYMSANYRSNFLYIAKLTCNS